MSISRTATRIMAAMALVFLPGAWGRAQPKTDVVAALINKTDNSYDLSMENDDDPADVLAITRGTKDGIQTQKIGKYGRFTLGKKDQVLITYLVPAAGQPYAARFRIYTYKTSKGHRQCWVFDAVRAADQGATFKLSIVKDVSTFLGDTNPNISINAKTGQILILGDELTAKDLEDIKRMKEKGGGSWGDM